MKTYKFRVYYTAAGRREFSYIEASTATAAKHIILSRYPEASTIRITPEVFACRKVASI